MPNNQKYKLCILAAGKGTRNTTVVNLHKALLPLENRAVISHIINSVSKHIEIVIAVGYLAEQVTSYVTEVFPDRNISFVHIDNYDGPGSGPGLSLLKCKDYLQTPFIFTSADTVVKESFIYEKLEENWLGVATVPVEQSINYCLVQGSKYLDKLYYGTGTKAYIGVAGIYSYQDFWDSLENHKIIKDEYQVVHGFDGLDKIRLLDFTWFDTGNNAAYNKAREHFSNEIVAVKAQESLFVDEGKVIKYFADSAIVTKRVQRTKFLSGYAPAVRQLNSNMYSYDFVPGQMLSNVLDDNILKDALSLYLNELASTQFEKDNQFLANCKTIYEEKIYSRITYFANSKLDRIQYINGVQVPPILDLLDRVDWNLIYNTAIPSRFHGDFQPENIVYGKEGFKLIDWRDSFGSSLEIGDMYYDLGKLYHALIINGQVVLDKGYYYEIQENNAFIGYNIKSNLQLLLDLFETFCEENKLNWHNVKLLGILQYIGICSLYEDFHEGRYGEFLFLLGKYMLTKNLNNGKLN